MIDPAWVAAASAAVVALLGLGVVARWWLLQQVLRGSAAAIIALLGESSHQIMTPKGTFRAGRLSSRSKVVYIVVGSERYVLCARDLDRLRNRGYVIRLEGGTSDRSYRLSRLGQMLLERPDNGRMLASGIVRARLGRPNCVGGCWLRCWCETYRYRIAGRAVPLPFFVGKAWRYVAESRVMQRPSTEGQIPGDPGRVPADASADPPADPPTSRPGEVRD